MPPKKRKAEAAPADDGGVDSSGGGTTPATKKSKKDAAAEARARAKAWRDGRRQQQQQSSAAKTTVATTPSSPSVVHAVTTAPFSTGKKSPKKAASSTTSPKRRRTPVKRAAAATSPGSTRRKSTTTSSTATPPSSSQQQPAKKSRRTVVPTNFQFDETAVVGKQATTTTTTEEENELLPTSPSSDKKKKQQEGRARIENLRKKRQQSGLKVASPLENDDTNMIMTEETTTFTTKTLTVTPGKIGLSLTVDLAKGGATVTRVDPTSRFIGQIHVGDVITKIDGRLIKTVEDVHVNAEKVRLFQIVSGGGEQEEEVDMAAAAAGGEDPPVLASATSKTAVDPPPSSSSSSSLAPAVTAKRQAVSSSQKPELPAAVASIFSQQTPSTTAHRPDATAKYNPNQPFPTQGYKLSTAAYCGCGPTPSNTTTATTKVGRSGSGTLQQLRESMRNAPAVKRASEGEDDEKMAARPSPPGKVGAELAATAAESTAAPSAIEPTTNEEENAGILKASISRAQQLVSSVAFANRQRRVKLGIKSDLTETDSASPVMERGSEKLISPSVDPPGGNAPVVEKTGEDVRAEESALDEVYDEEIPRVSVVRKVMKGIYTLLKWASILPLAIGVLYLLSSLRGDTSVAQLDSKAAKDDVVSPACFMDYPSDIYFAGENVTGDDGCGGNYIQCPQWGRCHGGALGDCEDGGGGEWQGLVRFVPNEGGTACVPSDPALMIMKIVQDALVNMTVAQSCRTSDMITDPASVLLVEQEPYPLFSLDVVSWTVNKASEVDITMSAELLLWLQPVFETKLVSFGQLSETDDVPNAIGLSSEVPEHKLPVPLSCQMKFIFMELFGWLLKLLYRVIVLLMQKLWQYISTYPKSSPVMLMLLVGVVTIRRKKKHRAKVREIFDVVKEEAYDRLAHSDGSGGYAALHLRDDVGHAMYPSNVRERLFMYNYVWPKLIIEVRADNRVRKFRKAADGKQLEHWDLNTNSKRGWQMRKTPNKTPAKTVEAMPSAKKRDP